MSKRAGRRVAQQARALRRRNLRVNARVLCLIMGVLATSVVGIVAIMGYWRGQRMAYFAAGAGIMSLLWVLDFAASSIQVQRLEDGAAAERYTSLGLRRLKPRGWRSVDHVEFHLHDVDHVAAGPGGLFAVETKWTNEPWRIVEGRFVNKYAADAVKQCARGAEKIGWLLKDRCGSRFEVTPLLAIWGPGQPELERPIEIDGVLVVQGVKLEEVLDASEATLELAARDTIISALEEFVAVRDEHDSVRRRTASRSAVV